MYQNFNDELVDYDKYDEVDLEYIRGNKKITYETSFEKHYYVYQDADGDEQELFTTVQLNHRITHGTFDPAEDSDWDYLGYTDLISWLVLSVENNEGDEVDPEKVLTPEQFLEYTQGLTDFIGD